ncbi:MAG: hypothetical protein AVO39_02170 [delta proteobacterium MLS_D]|jgi:hypothetical protein|nr:MAG: hypothetical protein AVO39_02170 [delta proteobacterium MLS_D]
MSDKQLAALGVAALIMVLLTVIITREAPVTTDDAFKRGSYLVQGLDPQRVDGIYLERAGESLRLARSGERFVIRDKNDYPAVTKRVNDLFMTVVGIRCDELVTADSDNHATLGVDGGERSTIIRFLDEDGKPKLGVIIGTAKEENRSIRSYVRLEGDDRVYLSERTIPFVNVDFGGYVRERFFEEAENLFTELRIVNQRGRVAIQKKDGDFIVEGVSDVDGKAAGDLLNRVVTMRLTDIAGKGDIDDITFETELTLVRRDKIIHRIKLGSRDGACFAKLEAIADFPGGEIVISPDESDESLREKEALIIAAEAVDTFNEQHQGWIYEVDGACGDFISKTPAELLLE